MKRDNHFVAQSYLKKWTDTNNKVWSYRIIVSHKKVPHWKSSSLKAIAYYKDLYTLVLSSIENDEMEIWFDREFENPAQKPINKAISGGQLSKDDWYNIIRYLAMQDIRTPKRLIEHIKSTQETLPVLMNNVLNEIKDELVNGNKSNDSQADFDHSDRKYPLKVYKEPIEDSDFIRIKVESVPGRASWLNSIKHQLENTSTVLHRHKWSILHPADGHIWPTSDCPVIKLNYYRNGSYNFNGGWARKGTEILFPLSPKHLVYTKIGFNPPKRGTDLDHKTTLLLNRLIIKSAHRMIFSNKPDDNIVKVRPRLVDPQVFHNERNNWLDWHQQQSEVEKEFL